MIETTARAWDAVAWSRRDAVLRDADGAVVFEAADVEAPVGWSDVAVATVASRWMAAGERSVRDMVRRVVEALGSWAQSSGHVASDARRRQFEDALARLVLGQRATFATPGVDEPRHARATRDGGEGGRARTPVRRRVTRGRRAAAAGSLRRR